MIRIALIALLAAAAISQPIGEPIVQEKITHSKPVITEQYGPAEVISENEAHRLVKQYMNEANQQNQFQKLNWNVAGSDNSADANAAANNALLAGAGAANAAQFNAAPGGSNFYLAKRGGYEWLGNNGAAKLSALMAPKTYTTTTTSYANAAPAGAFQWNSPVQTQSFQWSAPAKTESFQYVNAAPAVPAAQQYSTVEYNSAPAFTVDAAPAVDVSAPAAIQTSSFNFESNQAPAFQFNAAPAQYTSSFSANESPMSEIVQEKDLGLGASSTSAQIEQVKTPVSAETFTFGSKSTANRFGSKF